VFLFAKIQKNGEWRMENGKLLFTGVCQFKKWFCLYHLFFVPLHPQFDTTMKKTFTFSLFFGFALSLSALANLNKTNTAVNETTPLIVKGCNVSFDPDYGKSWNIVNFGTNFGTVSFVSDQEWQIVLGDGSVQIWSDAVQATACDKENFVGSLPRCLLCPDASCSNCIERGRTTGIFLTDCCSSPEHKGHYFSWCAIARFAHVLCPEPWRVPTAKDFCELDKALFGTTACRSNVTTPEKLTETYINTWGGAFSGTIASQGGMHHSNTRGYYWSSTEYSEEYPYHLQYNIHGNVQPQSVVNIKSLGFSLRCVRTGAEN